MESRAEMEAARLARARAKRARHDPLANDIIDLTQDGARPGPAGPKLAPATPAMLTYAHGRIGITPTRASTVQIPGPIISIGDLLASSTTMTTVIISSFVVDIDWILSEIGNDQIPIYLVKHWSRQDHEKPGRYQSSTYRNCTFIHPVIRTGFGCVHPKIMIIFHEKSARPDQQYIRVVISSGNLIQVDYEMMENLVFVQDFPRIRACAPGPARPLPSEAAAAFRDDLKDYLAQLSVPFEQISRLDQYDYSLATVRIVSSIPGQHQNRYGLHSLKQAISKLNLNLTESEYRSNDLHLECQCSSLGALNRTWLNEFYYNAAAPDSPMISKTSITPIRVAFPSQETVMGSLAGQLGGGSSIRFSPKHWHASTFPRDILRDCLSVRTGTLMHSKMIIGRLPRNRATSVGDAIGWIYFGSHNFTRAAWGGFVKSGSHLTMNNYEIGVIIPVRKVHVPTGHRLDGKHVEPDPDQVWEESLKQCPVPIPFIRPMPSYNGKTPWFPTGQSSSAD